MKPTLDRILDNALLIIGLLAVAYHMYTSQHLVLGNYENQAVHLAFLLVMLFLGAIRNTASPLRSLYFLILTLVSLYSTGYVLFNLEHLEMVVGAPEPRDLVVGVLIIFVVLEGTRLAWGATLPIVAIIFMAYFFFGHLIGGPLGHKEFSPSYVISFLSIGLSGIFGNFLSISANYVFLFVVFGALLEIIKVNDLFYELGKATGRVFRGGPGQTAVISSAMVGTVTGAAVANVAITGAFTIPYMKRSGYKPHIAGAIEATASTGGQLMPPIMGAAAFLMASFMGVPYAVVMTAALIPAILYFWGCVLSVQMIAVSENLIIPPEPVDKKLIVRRLPLFLLPLVILIVMLLMNYSPSNAAFWTILAAIALAYLSKDTRPTIAELAKSLAKGAFVGAQIGIALAVVGLMAQTLITTGLGTKIAGLVEILSGGNLLIALVITMLVSIVLGLGIPTSAAYAIVAIVVVPGLIKMGVMPLAAHFFALYFAVVSAITPPVALAALAGAGIAGANYMKTSLMAFKIAISGFIIPFLVVYNPVMVLQPESLFGGVTALIAISLAMTSLSALIFNCGITPFTGLQRLTAAFTTLSLFGFVVLQQYDDTTLDFFLFTAGILSFGWVLFQQLGRKRSTKPRS
jgi:TRAP transporter 4TM/12TM fusion protein